MIDIEPVDESKGACDCCGRQTRTVWGYVREDGQAIASYYMQFTVGATLITHPANFDLIYGAWGDGTTAADRCAVSLVHFENENGPGVMVIDAQDRPVAKSQLVGAALARNDVVGTPLATRAFAIFDAVVQQDHRLS